MANIPKDDPARAMEKVVVFRWPRAVALFLEMPLMQAASGRMMVPCGGWLWYRMDGWIDVQILEQSLGDRRWVKYLKDILAYGLVGRRAEAFLRHPSKSFAKAGSAVSSGYCRHLGIEWGSFSLRAGGCFLKRTATGLWVTMTCPPWNCGKTSCLHCKTGKGWLRRWIKRFRHSSSMDLEQPFMSEKTNPKDYSSSFLFSFWVLEDLGRMESRWWKSCRKELGSGRFIWCESPSRSVDS